MITKKIKLVRIKKVHNVVHIIIVRVYIKEGESNFGIFFTKELCHYINIFYKKIYSKFLWSLVNLCVPY